MAGIQTGLTDAQLLASQLKAHELVGQDLATQADLDALALSTGNLTAAQINALQEITDLGDYDLSAIYDVSKNADNYELTIIEAIALVPVGSRKVGSTIRFTSSSSSSYCIATFNGLLIDWLDPSYWIKVTFAISSINLVYSNKIEANSRRYIRASITEGLEYTLSSKSFDTLYTSGYYNDVGVKVGEIYYNTNSLVFDSNTNRYYKSVAVAPSSATSMLLIFTGDTDNTEFQIETKKSNGLPSYFESPYINSSYVSKNQFNFTVSKKVENISDFNEVSINTNNLYNPYTRLSVSLNTDGTNRYTSDFIEVAESESYYYTRPPTLNSYYMDVYNDLKVKTRSVLSPYITILTGEKYVKLLQVNGTTDTNATNLLFENLGCNIQFEKSTAKTAYAPMFKLKNYQLSTYLPNKFKNELFTNKTCYVIGDSITNAGYWTTALNTELSFKKFVVLGRDGCQWTDTLSGGVSTGNNIKERIDALEVSVTTNGTPDLIIIALGTNDWGNLKTIGDYALTMAKVYSDVSSRASVYDAIKYGVTRIKKLYSNCKIIIVTPIQRVGKYDTDYIEAILKGAKMMSVPCLDAYSNSGLIPYDDWLTLYYQDGLHETSLGGHVHGKYIANALTNTYYEG